MKRGVEMPKADKVDWLYLSLASVEVKPLRGGGGSDLGERKYGNCMFAERKWRWNQGNVTWGRERMERTSDKGYDPM